MHVACESGTWSIHVYVFLFYWYSSLGKFSKEELDDLRTEFTHHKDKVREYNRLLRVLTDHDDISENSVFSQSEMKEKQLEKLRNKLQDTHESLTKNYARLKEKTTGEKEGTGLFRDRRVTELWQKAQNGKFSNEELESIKVTMRSHLKTVQTCAWYNFNLSCFFFCQNLHCFLSKAPGVLHTFYSE